MAKKKQAEFDPRNPNSILDLDQFDYKNMVGEEFKNYTDFLEKIHPEADKQEGPEFDFELYHAKPVFKPRDAEQQGSKVDFTGIVLKEHAPPIQKARIGIKSARLLNDQIVTAQSRTGYGKYYLLSKGGIVDSSVKQAFQEVEVRRLPFTKEGNTLTTEFDILKVLRPRVLITQDQANEINSGRMEHEGNSIFIMYVLPDQKIEPLIREIR